MKDYKTFLWLLKINKKQAWRVLLLAASNVILALLSVTFALVTSRVVDSAIEGLDLNFWMNAAVLVALGLAQILLHFMNRHLSVNIVTGIDIHMKRMLFSDILRKDYSSVSVYHSGVLLSRLNDDIRIISDGMSKIMPGILGSSVRLIAAFGAVCLMDMRFAMAFLVLGVIAMLFATLLRKKMKQIHRQEQEATEQASSFMQESISNLLMIKTFGAEELIGSRADGLQNGRIGAIHRRRRYGALMNLMMNAAFHGGYIMGAVWCATRIATGVITVGMFSAVLQLIGQIERPLTTISGFVPQIATLLGSADRVREILNLPDENFEEQVSRDCYEKMNAICCRDISFAYDRDVVLDHADFTLKKGEFAVLGGMSGIGKSTLMKLLLGVYTQKSGEMYIDAEEKIPVGCATRNLFAYVPQGNFLLSGTLRENVCMMCPDATEEQIEQALYISDALDFVKTLPKGLDTVIGERGVGLSEGQLQRMAIARALLADAPVLLLDECTSALDEPTEERVLNNLRSMTDKTCLLISHKKAALQVCDTVYAIRDGKVTKV